MSRAAPVTILAIDNSSVFSAALCVGDATTTATADDLQASEQALPLITRLLSDAGVALRDCDAFAFAAGPGKFSALRLCCAIAKSFSYALGKPLIAVPSFAALAAANFPARAHDSATVRCALPAHRDHVYHAIAHYENKRWQVTDYEMLSATGGANSAVDTGDTDSAAIKSVVQEDCLLSGGEALAGEVSTKKSVLPTESSPPPSAQSSCITDFTVAESAAVLPTESSPPPSAHSSCTTDFTAAESAAVLPTESSPPPSAQSSCTTDFTAAESAAGASPACGDGFIKYPELLRGGRLCGDYAYPDAAAVLSVARGMYAGGEFVDALGAQPIYVRDKVALTARERRAKK